MVAGKLPTNKKLLAQSVDQHTSHEKDAYQSEHKDFGVRNMGQLWEQRAAGEHFTDMEYLILMEQIDTEHIGCKCIYGTAFKMQPFKQIEQFDCQKKHHKGIAHTVSGGMNQDIFYIGIHRNICQQLLAEDKGSVADQQTESGVPPDKALFAVQLQISGQEVDIAEPEPVADQCRCLVILGQCLE